MNKKKFKINNKKHSIEIYKLINKIVKKLIKIKIKRKR
jgi:hypothetical protein